MIVMLGAASIRSLIESGADVELHQLLSALVQRLQGDEEPQLEQLIQVIVFENSDTVFDLDRVLGFSVMRNRFNGTRFGDPDFQPCWEFIERHINWFEWVYVLSDGGAGVVVFMPVDAGNDLVPMLTNYTRL